MGFSGATVAAMALQASTGVAGFNLVNGTPVILSWTTPNDGLLHRVVFFSSIHVTSTETGGEIDIATVNPDGSAVGGAASGDDIYAGGLSAGTHTPFNYFGTIVGPNTTVQLLQGTALTGGAAILWAEIWGS